MILTSDTSPIRVDFLPAEATRLPGRLGMTLAPGKVGGGESGSWSRDLAQDLSRLREVYDAKHLVTLMEADELGAYGIGDLLERARAVGLAVLHAPIPDGGTPPSPHATVGLVGRIVGALARGDTVVVHCLGGLGRTGTIAACTLVGLGHGPDDAIARVRSARPRTVETPSQARFVVEFAAVARGRFGHAPSPAES
jgi:predicted protein tyrosine phosphatase